MASDHVISRVYAVYADAKLFDEWELMSQRVIALRSIVQNDIPLEHKELITWCDTAFKVEHDLADLRSRTVNYIVGGNE